MPTEIRCYVCNSPAQEKFIAAEAGEPISGITCPRCGEYRIFDKEPLDNIEAKGRAQRLFFSSWLREQGGILVSAELVDKTIPITPPTVHEKAVRLLRWFTSKHPAGHHFKVPGEDQINNIVRWQFEESNVEIDPSGVGWILELLGECWINDGFEYYMVFNDYAVEEMKWFFQVKDQTYRIGPIGFIQIEKERSHPDLEEMIFIAMWMNPKMNRAYNTFANAVMDAGYKPLRVDTGHPEGTIDDAIISGIRHAKGIVADFTRRRGGVYFEAGFALGLTRLVIYTCKDAKADRDELHFDVEHRPFIFWKDTNPGRLALKRKITERIEAHLGKGHQSFTETERNGYLLPEE